MTHPIRSILVLAALAVVLAACGTTVGGAASDQPSVAPSVAPSEAPSEEPSEAPSDEPTVAPASPDPEEREVAGTITVAGMAFSGPGGTIAEAIANGSDTGDLPSLVNGVLFRDLDGRIYLATALSDASVPTFDGPMLEVLGMASDGPSWDMANAELIGLEEANGIVFKPDSQVLGFVDLP